MILQTCQSDVSRALRQWLIPLVERRLLKNIDDSPSQHRMLSTSPTPGHIILNHFYIPGYLIWRWKITIFKNGKPSISMGHLYHGKLLVITRGYFDRCWKSNSCLTSAFKSDMVRKRLLVSLVDSRKVQPSAAFSKFPIHRWMPKGCVNRPSNHPFQILMYSNQRWLCVCVMDLIDRPVCLKLERNVIHSNCSLQWGWQMARLAATSNGHKQNTWLFDGMQYAFGKPLLVEFG